MLHTPHTRTPAFYANTHTHTDTQTRTQTLHALVDFAGKATHAHTHYALWIKGATAGVDEIAAP